MYSGSNNQRNITQRDSEFLCKLLPGDILVMRADRDIISKSIRWWTRSEYSHVATYVGNGNLVEAIWTGVRKLHWVDTLYAQKYNVIAVRHKNMTPARFDTMLRFQASKIGAPYDFLKIVVLSCLWVLKWLGLDIRRYRSHLNIDHMYTCVELVVEAMEEAQLQLFCGRRVDHSQVIPQDFVNSDSYFERVAEYIP